MVGGYVFGVQGLWRDPFRYYLGVCLSHGGWYLVRV